MNMKKIMIASLMMAFFLMIGGKSQAQSDSLQSIDFVKQQLKHLNSVFDSSYFLSYNVKFLYNSLDSVSGQSDSSSQSSSYIVKGNCFYYSLGDYEYMQNDSLAFSVSNKEKVIICSKNRLPGASFSFAAGSLTDTSIGYFAKYYRLTGSVDTSKNKGVIYFNALAGTAVPFQQIVFKYQNTPAQHTSVEVKYKEPGIIEEKDSTGAYNGQNKSTLLNKTMTMIFSDYANVTVDNSLFKKEHYMFFDRQLKKFVPVDKFKQYKVFVRGI